MVDTLVVLLLDQSGSMLPIKEQTISGVNEYISSIATMGKNVKFTQVNFNSDEITTVYDNLPTGEVPNLTSDKYNPSAATPLYDAIGKTIVRIDSTIKTYRDKHKKLPHVLFVIMTDGLENDSKEFIKSSISNLIKSRTERGWTFVYLGANQDAWSVGGGIGIANNMTYDIHKIKETFGKLASSTGAYVSNSSSPTETFWDGKIKVVK